MNKLYKFLFLIFSILLLIYVSLPTPGFPNPPEGFVQSDEPADVETPLRRGYYTNMTRAEVINFYKQQFNQMKWVPQLRFNYPPEEAQVLIRDQTKSTFLEELVHPLRESMYINGFESEGTIYELNYKGSIWKNKIIIRYIPSSIYARFIVSILVISSIYLLSKEYIYAIKKH